MNIKLSQEELMMKAAVQFEGRYPDSPNQEIIAIGVCIKDIDAVLDPVLEDCFKFGDISELGESYSTEYWEVLCNQHQFEEFVDANYTKGETK